MCYSATFPSVVKSENVNSDLLNLTRIFNRWLKMLTTYGKLDENGRADDFAVIAMVIKSAAIGKDVKRAVRKCRDHVLRDMLNVEGLIRALSSALRLMCRAMEDREIRIIKKHRADQGMRERYRPLTKRLERERIRKIDRRLIYTDPHTDDAETTKLVRRIVEKRAAQMVYALSGHCRETNMFRQSVRRATSFSLYTSNFTDYDAQKRAPGTHWRVVYSRKKDKKMLKAKQCYNSYEEAVVAVERHQRIHSEDERPMRAYKCEHCGKWHIGHDRSAEQLSDVSAEILDANDEKVTA